MLLTSFLRAQDPTNACWKTWHTTWTIAATSWAVCWPFIFFEGAPRPQFTGRVAHYSQREPPRLQKYLLACDKSCCAPPRRRWWWWWWCAAASTRASIVKFHGQLRMGPPPTFNSLGLINCFLAPPLSMLRPGWISKDESVEKECWGSYQSDVTA